MKKLIPYFIESRAAWGEKINVFWSTATLSESEKHKCKTTGDWSRFRLSEKAFEKPREGFVQVVRLKSVVLNAQSTAGKTFSHYQAKLKKLSMLNHLPVQPLPVPQLFYRTWSFAFRRGTKQLVYLECLINWAAYKPGLHNFSRENPFRLSTCFGVAFYSAAGSSTRKKVARSNKSFVITRQEERKIAVTMPRS